MSFGCSDLLVLYETATTDGRHCKREIDPVEIPHCQGVAFGIRNCSAPLGRDPSLLMPAQDRIATADLRAWWSANRESQTEGELEMCCYLSLSHDEIIFSQFYPIDIQKTDQYWSNMKNRGHSVWADAQMILSSSLCYIMTWETWPKTEPARLKIMLYTYRSSKQWKHLRLGRLPFVRRCKAWKMRSIPPSSVCNKKPVVLHRKNWNFSSSRWKLLLSWT